MAELRQLAAYRSQSAGGRERFGDIVELARTSPRAVYYLEKLHLLLSTPEAAAADTTARQVRVLARSRGASDELTRGLPPVLAAALAAREERATASGRQWTALKGDRGEIYWVDRRDPSDVHAVIYVKLRGEPARVALVKELEDAIEKHLGVDGFTVDLRFTDREGAGVFEVSCDPKRWTTAYNWVGTHWDLGHELMHLFGLADEYDYIESHAANRHMTIENRLYWFHRQMQVTPPPDAELGIMSSSTKRPLPRHIRQVAQLPEPRAAAGVQLRR